MRFTKLVVESFQAIQSVEIEFGPGLNILYGPNDLGKSTLASAIRAGLLVAPGSTHGSTFAPWYADVTPTVSLSFAHESGHHWRVFKTFGSSGAKTRAEIHHSKDGVSFSLDCKGREVEEKVRDLLAWGIPAPGGKSGAKSLPTSFLANVLLGAQTDVDGILGDSIANDLDGTGKLRLSKALATLAQDPLFKRVFDAAQLEVDQCFTDTGRRKKGKDSKFTSVGQQVKDLGDDLAALRRQLAISSSVEEGINALRERHAQAEVQLGEATTALSAVRARLAQTQAKAEASERLATARAGVATIDAHAARVDAVNTEVTQLEVLVAGCDKNVAAALAAVDGANAAVRAAEDAHRIATSDDGAKERELRRAQLAERLADTNVRKQRAETRRSEVTAAIAARALAERSRAEASALANALEKGRLEIKDALEKGIDAEKAVELARSLIAYGRWHAMVRNLEERTKAQAAAQEARAAADERDASAAALEAESAAIATALAADRATLPTAEEAKTLERLEHEVAIANAALGGGLSIALRPRRSVSIRAEIDNEPTFEKSNVAAEHVFQAERSLRLSIDDLVDIEVTAGAAEKRKAAEALKLRWAAEAIPVLERAQRSSVAGISSALEGLAVRASKLKELTVQASQLRKEAASARERAAVQDEQAKNLIVDDTDVEARKTAVGTIDHRILQSQLDALEHRTG